MPFVNSADSKKKLTERTAVVQQARMNAKGAAQAGNLLLYYLKHYIQGGNG